MTDIMQDPLLSVRTIARKLDLDPSGIYRRIRERTLIPDAWIRINKHISPRFRLSTVQRIFMV